MLWLSFTAQPVIHSIHPLCHQSDNRFTLLEIRKATTTETRRIYHRCLKARFSHFICTHEFNFPAEVYKYIPLKQANIQCTALVCAHSLDLDCSFQFIIYSSRVITRSLWHLWNDSSERIQVALARITAGPAPQESKCGSELWKQWTEFKPLHVFLWSVSGNGSRSKIKRRGGPPASEKKGNDETVAPPGKNAMYGTWCRVGGHGWGLLGFQVWWLTLSSQEKEGKRERGGGLRNWAACQQGGVLSKLDPCSMNTGHITPLWKRREKKKQSDSVHVLHQSHVLPWPTKCCNSPLCWLQTTAQ